MEAKIKRKNKVSVPCSGWFHSARGLTEYVYLEVGFKGRYKSGLFLSMLWEANQSTGGHLRREDESNVYLQPTGGSLSGLKKNN